MELSYIYFLHTSDMVHYVGQTFTPARRECEQKRKYPNSIFEIIDVVPVNEWEFWEKHYISLFKSWGI